MHGIIDTHNHLWLLAGEHFDWITADLSAIRRDFLIDELKQTLQANEVSGSILVQAVPELSETRWLLEIAEKHDLVKGVIGWVDMPSGAAVGRDLDALLQQSARLKGIRYMSQGLPPEHLTTPAFIDGVRAVGERGLVYELLITPAQLTAAETLVAHCPDVRFVVEHIAKPAIRNRDINEWRADLARIAAHGNVYCKLSGMVTEADWAAWTPQDIEPYIDAVFDCFGDNRVMYGSDWPVLLLAGDYRRVLGLCRDYLQRHPAISADRFFQRNAEQVYQLQLL